MSAAPIDTILAMLPKVRQRQPGQWSACCPAHDDTGPSLSIRETPEGAVLLHCFAGCQTHDVVAALGLDIAALFPPRELSGHEPKHPPRLLTAGQALELLDSEAHLVAVAGANVLHGVVLTQADIMPVHSVDAARTWRAKNIAPTMHGHTKRQAAPPSPTGALPQALALLDIAAAALASGQTIDALVPVLRLALRAVPEHERDPDVLLPAEVMDVLTAEVFDAIEQQDTPQAGRADMTDDEAAEMGRFWYQVAAGEIRPA